MALPPVPDPCHVVQVQDLTVHFGAAQRTFEAVRGLSFHVARGETLAIVGESGSGKSVTSLALMRLVEYGGGRIVHGSMALHRRTPGQAGAGGGDIVDLRAASQSAMRAVRGADMAMVFQEPMTSLNPVFTVGAQIAESLTLHQGLHGAQARAAALRALEQVRIPEAAAVLRRYPHQLSGGMRQRVMIAMALACRPALLIADEPTTALDVTIQAQILHLIRQLQQELDMAVIFITHDMGVVAEVADRVLVMWRGEKVEEGTCAQVLTQPQHHYTRALLSAVPRLGAMRGLDAPQRFCLLAPEPAEAGQSQAVTEPAQIAPAPAASPILRVRGLSTRFDVRSGLLARVRQRVHAVEQVSFDLWPGETLSLVGESGCGKSTTARALLRLAPCHSGHIQFDGRDITTLSPRHMRPLRQHMQCIFQDPFASLNPRATVGDSIVQPLLTHGVLRSRRSPEARQRVAELLQRVGLSPDMAQRWPHEFSGGQRQRICIARALALKPKVVIADESVSALDVSIQAQIVNLMIDLQRQTGIAFLFISHDMAVVERISHRVAVMYLGQIVEIGPRRAIFENPAHPYTQKLMAAVPQPDPHAPRRPHAPAAPAELPSPVRAAGDEPVVEPLVQVGAGHFVARHRVGGGY